MGSSPAGPAEEEHSTMSAAKKSTGALAAVALTVACASTSFQSTWKAPDAQKLGFKGHKVAALVVSKEEGVRYGAEDALARELSALGVVGIPAYSLIPKELVQDKEKAKEFLEKAQVKGVVAMRVVGREKELTQTSGTYWGGPAYATFWGAGYYGYGWGAVYDPGYLRTDTIVTVETLVYSLEQDNLVWAAQSQTTNPEKVGPFIKELVSKSVSELKKQGLVG
jgi:hypothetical protein